MQALVNTALRDFIESRFGEAAWRTVTARTGMRLECFTSDEAYPDEVTLSIVRAVCDVTGLTREQVLEGFGEQWVLSATHDENGRLMKACGSSLREFLLNLETVQALTGVTIPGLRCRDSGESLRLEYRSSQAGTGPMVRGLVKGLARIFETSIDLRNTRVAGRGSDFDEFLVRFQKG